MKDRHVSENISITVGELIRSAPAEMELSLAAGEGGLAERRITSDRLQKFGLALSGSGSQVRAGRIQMIGGFETAFLEKFPEAERIELLRSLDAEKIPCIVITRGNEPIEDLLRFADSRSVPLITTPLISSKASAMLTEFLQERLAAEIVVHGVLIEIDGVGVLITGESGIGKSECALDLVSRGHRLVSDDTVRIRRIGNRVVGSSPELTFEHLEIRGLGIVNIRELFGVSAVCESMSIDLCIELRRWEDAGPIDRIGSKPLEEDLLGVRKPKFIFPVRPGRNLSNLVETAVKLFLAGKAGRNAAERLLEKHAEQVGGS